MSRIVIALLVTGVVCQPIAAASAPLQLQPSTVWTLNYNPERCSLMREFGSGDSRVHLEIVSFGSWNSFQVFLTGPAIHKTDNVEGWAGVRLTGDREERRVTTFQGKSRTFGAILFGLSFLPLDDDRALQRSAEQEGEDHAAFLPTRPDYDATVEDILVRQENGGTVDLKSGSMAQPLAALRHCVDDLVSSWGGNPAVEKVLSRGAMPVKRTVSRVQGDYPRQMLAGGINGFVPVRLSVDAAGNASNCTIQLENVDKAFAKAVCDNLTGKFEPALDSQGHPVPTIFHTHVIYRVE